MMHINNDEDLGRSYQYSGSDFSYTRHIKKTRVQHKCIGCEKPIPKGSSCTRYVGSSMGKFFQYYVCECCQ